MRRAGNSEKMYVFLACTSSRTRLPPNCRDDCKKGSLNVAVTNKNDEEEDDKEDEELMRVLLEEPLDNDNRSPLAFQRRAKRVSGPRLPDQSDAS